MAHRFYDCLRWRNLRNRILSEKPLCKHCEDKGITEIATQVDHIIPISEGGNPTSMDNLQPLCATCHSRKTRNENTTEKAIETQLGYADSIIIEKVVTKQGKGKKAFKAKEWQHPTEDENGTPYDEK